MRRCCLALFVLTAGTSVLAQTEWPAVGNDKGAMRYSPLAQIDRENVKNLTVAWTLHTGGLSPDVRNSAIQCTPIVVDGVDVPDVA